MEVELPLSGRFELPKLLDTFSWNGGNEKIFACGKYYVLLKQILARAMRL